MEVWNPLGYLYGLFFFPLIGKCNLNRLGLVVCLSFPHQVTPAPRRSSRRIKAEAKSSEIDGVQPGV